MNFDVASVIANFLRLPDFLNWIRASKTAYQRLLAYHNHKELLEVALRKKKLQFALELFQKYPKLDPSTKFGGFKYDVECGSLYSTLECVAFIGFQPLLELLLADSRIDPAENKSNAIIFASYRGHHLIVRRLMEDRRVNPADGDIWAIISASMSGHHLVVGELLKDGRDHEGATIRIELMKKLLKYTHQRMAMNLWPNLWGLCC